MKNQVLIVNCKSAEMKETVTQLEKSGVDVRRAADAESALFIISILHPPVVIVDTKLPGMNCITFAQTLKEDDTNKNLIVIAIMDFKGEDYRKYKLTSMFDGLIKKTPNSRKMFFSIKRFLKNEPKESKADTPVETA
jgi:DNA-binding response OmpR family regulator